MATVSFTDGNTGIPAKGLDRAYVVKKRINFATTTATAADVIQCITIKAGTHVLNAGSKIITAEGGVATAQLGFGGDPNGFRNAIDLNATAATIEIGVGGTDAYVTAGGTLITTADTLDLTLGHNMDACIVDIFAICIDLNS